MTQFWNMPLFQGFGLLSHPVHRAVRKPDVVRNEPQVPLIPMDELERLAETSPHLLEDIGFVRDARQSNSIQTVWVSNRGEVVVSGTD